MITFKEYLTEEKKPTKYYPYKLNRWKKGQKKRTISMSNSYYVSHKKLSKKVADARRLNKTRAKATKATIKAYRKKTKKR